MVRPEFAAPPGVPVAEPTEQGMVQSQKVRLSNAPWWAFALLPSLTAGFVMAGFSALDSPEPASGAAATSFTLGIIAMGGACYVWARRGATPMQWGGASASAALMGVWCATLVEGSYGPAFFGPGASYVLWALFLPLVAVGVVLGVLGIWWPAQMRLAGETAGMGFGIGVAGAMAYLLITLDRQAELARQAHELPPPAAVWFMLVLLACAALRRR